MHSKYKLWDFNQNQLAGSSITVVNLFDPLIRTKIQDSLVKSFGLTDFKVLQAKEVGASWIEDNINSMSLFGDSESYIITDGENLNKDFKSTVLSQELELDSRKIIIFYNKSDSFTSSLKKQETIASLTIQAPAFWEYDLLLEHMAFELEVSLSHEAKQFILEYVEHHYIDFLSTLSRIKMSLPDSTVNLKDVETLIDRSRVDSFEFAGLFGFKKGKDFYEKLLESAPSNDELRSLFYFLQTHLLKIKSVDSIYAKSKLSKYDKQIISQAKIWKPIEITKAIDFLKQVEVKAKLKDPLLKSDLKSLYLKSIL